MKETLLIIGILLLYCLIGAVVSGIMSGMFGTYDQLKIDMIVITIFWPIALSSLVSNAVVTVLYKIARFTFLIVRKIKKS